MAVTNTGEAKSGVDDVSSCRTKRMEGLVWAKLWSVGGVRPGSVREYLGPNGTLRTSILSAARLLQNPATRPPSSRSPLREIYGQIDRHGKCQKAALGGFAHRTFA